MRGLPPVQPWTAIPQESVGRSLPEAGFGLANEKSPVGSVRGIFHWNPGSFHNRNKAVNLDQHGLNQWRSIPNNSGDKLFAEF